MGRFYFNKTTGETYLPTSEKDLPPGVTVDTKIAPRKRKKVFPDVAKRAIDIYVRQ